MAGIVSQPHRWMAAGFIDFPIDTTSHACYTCGMMNDHIGRPLVVGQAVAFGHRHKYLKTGRVLKLAQINVKIGYRTDEKKDTWKMMSPEQVLILDESDYAVHCLRNA